MKRNRESKHIPSLGRSIRGAEVGEDERGGGSSKAKEAIQKRTEQTFVVSHTASRKRRIARGYGSRGTYLAAGGHDMAGGFGSDGGESCGEKRVTTSWGGKSILGTQGFLRAGQAQKKTCSLRACPT
jgi:hypothetical protein